MLILCWSQTKEFVKIQLFLHSLFLSFNHEKRNNLFLFCLDRQWQLQVISQTYNFCSFRFLDFKIFNEKNLLSALIATKNDDEKRRNKIYQRKETQADYKEKCRKIIEKIERMCSYTVQQKIFCARKIRTKVKNEAENNTSDLTDNIIEMKVLIALQNNWILLKLWNHLKSMYTLRNSSVKWDIFNRLQQMFY